MSKNAKFGAVVGAALVLAIVVWATGSHDPGTPTAPAPRGQFATDRAAEEPALPVKLNP